MATQSDFDFEAMKKEGYDFNEKIKQAHFDASRGKGRKVLSVCGLF